PLGAHPLIAELITERYLSAVGGCDRRPPPTRPSPATPGSRVVDQSRPYRLISSPSPSAADSSLAADSRLTRRRSVQRTPGGSVGGRAHQVRVDLQRLGDLAGTVLRPPGQRPLGLAPARQLLLVDIELQQALVDVHNDPVTVLDQADKPAFGGFRGDVPD